MSYDVFISHSSEDSEIARAVCAALEKNGIRCWIAPRNIVPGHEWMAAIAQGIDSCRLMVLLLSAPSNDSPYVQREVLQAISSEVVVLPFRVANIEPTGALRFAIQNYHRLDAFPPPREVRMTALVDAVTRLLGKTDAPSPTAGETPRVPSPTQSGSQPTRVLWKVPSRRILAALAAVLFSGGLLGMYAGGCFPNGPKQVNGSDPRGKEPGDPIEKGDRVVFTADSGTYMLDRFGSQQTEPLLRRNMTGKVIEFDAVKDRCRVVFDDTRFPEDGVWVLSSNLDHPPQKE